MTTHATGPLAGLSWLVRGINLGYRNARATFGAAAIVMMLSLVPNLLQVLAQSLFQPGGSGSTIIAALTTVLSIVILSPAIGGYLRLIDACEHGRPAHASDILQPFARGGGAFQLIGFGMLMTLACVAIAAVVIAPFGNGLDEWYEQIVDLSRQGGQIDPDKVPEPPEGLAQLLGIGSVVGVILSGIYAIGFGQVALGHVGVGAAIRDGVIGTLKNLLPMGLLAIATFFGSMLLLLVLAAVIGPIAAAIHPSLLFVLMVPPYLALLLALHVVMFGVMYHFWRDVCGDGTPPRDDQVAV
ncbi:hypothetical protein FKV24_001855 [Lysobacter maris]|uniref:Uncharacterized protein n=1 Tax=Marilutibacter maris TaxID=1605891 RepID=A0A508B9M8_9GAMM|nr:hypothetical protein [Lysobacter maris]KAB8198480.1 hypothetical protein FKV24_001855 [Lysobacter maris]